MTDRLRRESRKVKIANIVLEKGAITDLACIKMITRLYEQFYVKICENPDEIEMFLEKHNN